MWVIIGLGNPGKKYRETRHNIGFQAVEKLATAWGIQIKKKVSCSLTGQGNWQGESVFLVLPQTYMNQSGEAIKELISGAEARLEEFLVICDDMALPIGSIRLRAQGSAGGHQGLNSMIQQLGTDYFTRLRIGISFPKIKEDVSEYVLSPFSKEEWKKLEPVLDEVPKICEIWMHQGIQKAMSRFNTKKKPESRREKW